MRKEDDMVKFILGVVVGLICGVLLTVILPIFPNSADRYEVVRTGNPPLKEEVSKKIVIQEEHTETFYETMANAFDEETQAQWKKITGDPVWDQLADEDKMNIWGAFEKTYVSTQKAQDHFWFLSTRCALLIASYKL
jgi:hypothetical protein